MVGSRDGVWRRLLTRKVNISNTSYDENYSFCDSCPIDDVICLYFKHESALIIHKCIVFHCHVVLEASVARGRSMGSCRKDGVHTWGKHRTRH